MRTPLVPTHSLFASEDFKGKAHRIYLGGSSLYVLGYYHRTVNSDGSTVLNDDFQYKEYVMGWYDADGDILFDCGQM